jgi:hypothetical protein
MPACSAAYGPVRADVGPGPERREPARGQAWRGCGVGGWLVGWASGRIDTGHDGLPRPSRRDDVIFDESTERSAKESGDPDPIVLRVQGIIEADLAGRHEPGRRTDPE